MSAELRLQDKKVELRTKGRGDSVVYDKGHGYFDGGYDLMTHI